MSLRAVAQMMERAAKAGDLHAVHDLVPLANDELHHFRTAKENAGWQESVIEPEVDGIE